LLSLIDNTNFKCHKIENVNNEKKRGDKMEYVRMGKRGDIVIPIEIRNKYGFKPSDLFKIVDVDGVLILTKVKTEGELITELRHLGFLLKKEGLDRKSVLKLVDEVKSKDEGRH